jgi:hypothetical protein
MEFSWAVEASKSWNKVALNSHLLSVISDLGKAKANTAF